jgi:hypothetical protein
MSVTTCLARKRKQTCYEKSEPSARFFHEQNMILSKNHRLYGQSPELCIIRSPEMSATWVIFAFDGETFYPIQSIGSWPSTYKTAKEAIDTARKCQMTNEWKGYTIAIYYGGDGFMSGNMHERQVVETDTDIVKHILANA